MRGCAQQTKPNHCERKSTEECIAHRRGVKGSAAAAAAEGGRRWLPSLISFVNNLFPDQRVFSAGLVTLTSGFRHMLSWRIECAHMPLLWCRKIRFLPSLFSFLSLSPSSLHVLGGAEADDDRGCSYCSKQQNKRHVRRNKGRVDLRVDSPKKKASRPRPLPPLPPLLFSP
jgi:hypothetical protein